MKSLAEKYIGLIISLFILITNSFSVSASPAQTRLEQDISAGKPIIIQVSVALADNKHQWIVPVPESIGNGQDARTNLYWGARYGLKTYLIKDGRWQKVTSLKPKDDRILERLILKKTFTRNSNAVEVYLVADAWDGRYISETIKQFLSYNAGHNTFDIQLNNKTIRSGGDAHLIVYIGHNALMDYAGIKDRFFSSPDQTKTNQDNDAIVLACKSEPYFSSRLIASGAYPLVMTTGLMAPEAYSLDAAIKQWIQGSSETQIRKAAAKSYDQYQKTGRRAAERLFGVK